MNTRINAFIIDDEKEACNNLKYILADHIGMDINILGVANNTRDAVKKLQILKPDVVFLDIEMPNENAFQFLERVEKIDFEIVFVTAYDHYALRAFRLNAVDYILKPINLIEIKKAIEKIQIRLSYKQLNTDAGNFFNGLSKQINEKKEPTQILLRNNNNYDLIPFNDIIYIEASGSCCKIFFYKNASIQSVLMSISIGTYEELFPKTFFFRVHRSYFVNCKYITKLAKEEELFILLKTDIKIPLSRRRYTNLKAFLKNNYHL